MFTPIHIKTGLHMLADSIKVRFNGIKRYKGDSKEICRKIVKDCYNGEYFMVNTDHYDYFWVRDLGVSVDSLLKLGYRKEVISSLRYALGIFSKNKKISVAIYKDDKPFNFPDVYSPDSVAFLFRCLRVADAGSLVKKYKVFLNKEIDKFYNIVLDKKTGLVRRKTHFSGLRDYSIRDSSCYDNIMLAVLAEEVKRLGLDNPFRNYNFKENIKKNFWTGSYFLDDLSGRKHIAGDSNIFPFCMGIFNDKKMLKSAINSMQKTGLDKPMPLKFTTGKVKENLIPVELFVPGWQDDKIWFMIGPQFIDLVKKIDKKKANQYIEDYTEIIEKYGNFMELYTTDKKPYKSLAYHSGRSMLWAANYLTLR